MLVVEHDRATAAALAERLRAEGYEVRLAGSTERAGRSAPAAGPAATPICVSGLCIDVAARAVSLHGRPVGLRRLEYDLLAVLAREPRRVFGERQLMRLVWGHEVPVQTRTLASHASRLRRRLAAAEQADAAAAGGGRWIVNVRGVGYRLR